MRLIGNILWIVLFGGLITCLEYLLIGLVLCLTIVGMPFGLQCFKFAGLALLPFGRQIVHGHTRGPMSPVLNFFWLIFAGIWIAITHLGFALAAALTVIGVPFAIQHLKLARLGLLPFGREIR